MDDIRLYVEELKITLDRLPWEAIREVIYVLHDARMNDRQVFILGNGGSAATASHFACDLGKSTVAPDQPRFRAIALTDNMPIFSAYANDVGYEHVFAEQLASLVRAGDVVIGISGSGNSANVLKAIELARSVRATTIGFVGFDGGSLKEMVDLCIHVPSDCMEQVEDIHLMLEHLICSCLRKAIGQAECPMISPLFVSEVSGLRAAVFLDRDGVINENRLDYVKSRAEFVFLPGVMEPLRRLAQTDLAIVVITNQSAIGRGLVSPEEAEAINRFMVEEIERLGGRVDGVFCCPHRPDEGCECRKPRPGLLFRAAEELGLDLERSFLVGDALSDVEAARAAGCQPLLVLTGRGREQLPLLARHRHDDCPVVPDLAGAVDYILRLRERLNTRRLWRPLHPQQSDKQGLGAGSRSS